MKTKPTNLFGEKIKIKKTKEKTVVDKPTYPVSNLSYSSIRDYLRCPKLFYYQYVLKLRLKQKQMELVFGGAVHKALEVFHQSLDPIDAFTKEFVKEKLFPSEYEDFDRYVTEGHRLIKCYVDPEMQTYLKTYHEIEPEGESEKKFRLKINVNILLFVGLA